MAGFYAFMTYHQVGITTGATCGAGTAWPSGVPGFAPGFQWRSCCSIFTLFYVVFCRSVFVLLPLAFLLYVLIRLMSCHYPFGIFKLLLLQRKKPEKETNIFYKINTVVLILNKSLEAVSIKTEVDYVVVRER